MSSVTTLTSQRWRIRLPEDWVQGDDNGGGTIYFVSGDKAKGFYIGTWTFENDPRTADELIAHFRRVELSTLNEMEDSNWKVVSTTRSEVMGSIVSVMDCLDESNTYRIVGKILANPPHIVRANFHDYSCTDVDESDDYFAPIIDSLEFVA